ncbi:MAG: hypothetical protein LBG25_06005, partial [Spirochaetaceae bacterium]|nr:hypothetical protein [Spirochaetaceae bacterium]
MIEDFITAVLNTPSGGEAYRAWEGARGPPPRLSLAAILALNNYPIPDLKAFHRLAKEPYQGLFPGLPHYENVLKGTNKAMPCMLLVLPYFLLINREMGGDGLFFMDSRPVCVRDNQDSYR